MGRSSYLPGETVNPVLEIVFDGYDANRRLVRFKDKSGAVIERRDR